MLKVLLLGIALMTGCTIVSGFDDLVLADPPSEGCEGGGGVGGCEL